VLFSARREKTTPIAAVGAALPWLVLWLALAAILLAQLSCTRQPASPAPQRLAVLRFENLSSDPSYDWVGRAFQEILDTELAGAPDLYAIPSSRLLAMDRALGARPVSAPGISAGQPAALSLGATRIAYGDYTVRNGRLEARLSLADPRTGKIVAVLTAEGDGGDVLAAATSLARQISQRALGYATRSEPALHAYIDGLEAGRAEAESHAAAALEADPGFGPAARLLAGMRLERGDRAGALDCLNRALARVAEMPTVEQARLRLEIASLGSPPATRQEAFAAVAAAEPANPEAWMALGNFAFSRHDYGAAQTAFGRAAELDPTQLTALNQSAYAAAFSGHLDQAVASLRRCQELRPSDPNPLDSLGDVQLLTGHPREAEAFYLQAAKQDPHFQNGGDWLKAAIARLITGDREGADSLSEKYLQARFAAQGPAADLYRAQWRFLSGRRREGYRDLEAIARREGSGPERGDLAAEAHAQLAIWSLYLGDRAVAQSHARAALGAGQAAVLAAFLASPPASPAEWNARVEKLAPRPEQARIRDVVLAQALLLGKQFDTALPVLLRAYRNAEPTDPEMPVLLAWAYLETGQAAAAAPLLEHNPIPQPNGIDVFAACWFPRLFFLRGQVAEKQGRAEAARENYKLFIELSGDAPFQWGEEASAQAKLAGK
jgi:Flp pilus assembly protein TadD